MNSWLRDLAGAARSLARAPAFLAIAVLTLAVAIGANATVFSVVDGVLLDPLPFGASDRLATIQSSAPGADLPPEFNVSPAFYVQYRENAPSLEDVALYRASGGSMTIDGQAERLRMADVTHSLFSTLDVAPALGRLAEPTDLGPGSPPVLLISHALWVRGFGEDPAVLGREVALSGRAYTVIGVMDAGFRFPEPQTAVWVPFEIVPGQVDPGDFSWRMVARMKPGLDFAGLQTELTPLATRVPEQYPGADRFARFISDGRYQPVVRGLKESVVGELETPLWILLGAMGFVLLIACVNVANLFLVRIEGRQRDLAVRASLGAGRAQLIRAQLAEALVVAGLGGACGVIVAHAGVPLLVRAAQNGWRSGTRSTGAGLPRLEEIGLDGSVLLFTAGIALLSALVFGLLPALRSTAPRLLEQLRYAGTRTTSGRERQLARDAMVVVQAALALVLLVGSGLLVQSFRAVRSVDPGFEVEDVLTFQVALPNDAYPDAATIAPFHEAFLERLSALPGVESVGAIGQLPLDESPPGAGMVIEEAALPADGPTPLLRYSHAAPGYFQTMRIPILEGRTFSHESAVSGYREVIVSRSLAERRWPGEPALGKRLHMGDDTTGWETVVGVVGDVRTTSLREPVQEIVYLPLLARRNSTVSGDIRSPVFTVRARNAAALAPAVREEVRSASPNAPLYYMQMMSAVVRDSEARLGFTMFALGVSALGALLLGAIGLYGVLSYVVSMRTREIGVRLALGARASQVRRAIVLYGAKLTVWGVTLGLVGAAALTRWLESVLFGTAPLDLPTFVATAVAMLAVGLLASYVPARRASAVDPIESMRFE